MEIIEYKENLITLDVADRGKGWTWTYQIGSGPVIANIGSPHPSEALARVEAVAVAEREVDDDARTTRHCVRDGWRALRGRGSAAFMAYQAPCADGLQDQGQVSRSRHWVGGVGGRNLPR